MDEIIDKNDEILKLDISKYYNIQLSSLVLPDNYKKLIKHVMRAFAFDETFVLKTVADVVKIDTDKFAKCPGVGKKYVALLIEFKRELPNLLINVQVSMDEMIDKNDEILKLDISKYYKIRLSSLVLPDNYKKLIKRVMNAFAFDELDETFVFETVGDVIKIDPDKFAECPGVGKKYVALLIEFKRELPYLLKIQEELPQKITLSTEQLETPINKLALFNDNYSIDFAEIDAILIEDIENYLWTLNEQSIDIALSRWGFNQKHETLDEVGKRYDLTKERVRQIEKQINAKLSFHLRINFRIPSKILRANILEKMTEDLTVLLPKLAKCFATAKLFYAFIEFYCQVESGSIQEIVFTEISPKIINSMFCTNPSPITQETIINELISNYGFSKAAAINGIKQLKKINKIEITEQGIYPKNLGKIEAVAHVLTFHPAGLPWKDIVRIMNKKNYSKTPFNENRTTSGFHDSEFVYLCGLGTFRNVIFLDIEKFDIPKIMQHLINYFKQNQLTVLHLHDYYYRTKNQRDEIEYFTLRHLVREYGEEYGIYFNGISGTDSVSLDSDVKLISQADVIIKLLNESKFALTKQEIAEHLRSKSTRHARFYLSNLIEEGKVVRVDKMVYTTPEKAFSGFDIKLAMQIIQDIMNTSHDIVEADVFREYVNMELNLSYSKYIYVALVKTQLKELGWYRNNTLFSKNPISYKNLADICKRVFNPELSNDQNVKILQEILWITDSVAANSFQWWKARTLTPSG